MVKHYGIVIDIIRDIVEEPKSFYDCEVDERMCSFCEEMFGGHSKDCTYLKAIEVYELFGLKPECK